VVDRKRIEYLDERVLQTHQVTHMQEVYQPQLKIMQFQKFGTVAELFVNFGSELIHGLLVPNGQTITMFFAHVGETSIQFEGLYFGGGKDSTSVFDQVGIALTTNFGNV